MVTLVEPFFCGFDDERFKISDTDHTTDACTPGILAGHMQEGGTNSAGRIENGVQVDPEVLSLMQRFVLNVMHQYQHTHTKRNTS
jgi:hypothetical protein